MSAAEVGDSLEGNSPAAAISTDPAERSPAAGPPRPGFFEDKEERT